MYQKNSAGMNKTKKTAEKHGYLAGSEALLLLLHEPAQGALVVAAKRVNL
jgi:hypothetical protein